MNEQEYWESVRQAAIKEGYAEDLAEILVGLAWSEGEIGGPAANDKALICIGMGLVALCKRLDRAGFVKPG